jgi:hypothetical protein
MVEDRAEAVHPVPQWRKRPGEIDKSHRMIGAKDEA